MNSKMMPVSDLRRKMGRTIRALQDQDEDAVYITQHGQPQAVLLSLERYEQLRRQAGEQAAEPADLTAIRSDPALLALTEQIKAEPPDPAACRPATGSLAEALQNAPEDPDFDLDTWTRQWEAVEAEIKAIDRADDIAEGRE